MLLQLNAYDTVLTIDNFSHYTNDGRANYNYTFLVGGKILFSGNEFSPSPMDDLFGNDDQKLAVLFSLLFFLTLKDGDTDDEYFTNYTDDQVNFSKSPLCQDLSCIVYDFENGEFGEFFDYTVENSKIFTIFEFYQD